MILTGLGINADGGHLGGSLRQLEADLALFQRCGFDAVEIPIDGLDLVLDGRLHREQVARVQSILNRHDFAYSVHAPNRLNLAFPQRGPAGRPLVELERDVFAACLDFCAEIEAGVLVYHSGLIALHEAAFGLAALPDERELEEARAREVSELRSLMPLAAARGVVVAMENRDPHPWEVATLVQAGQPASQLAKYHAGMLVPDLVRQVAGVDHPNLGLTLDFGHLYLASQQCALDYFEAIRQGNAYIRHLHGSDNFGRLGGAFGSIQERVPYGEGDLHLPPGWGTIPFEQSLAQLPDYEGLFVLEIRPRFLEHLQESREAMDRIIERVPGLILGERRD